MRNHQHVVAGNVTKTELPWRQQLCEVGLEQAAWGSEGAQETAAGTQGSKGMAQAWAHKVKAA